MTRTSLPGWRKSRARCTPASTPRPTVCTLAILLPLLLLRRFQLAGHTPIAVVGGATGMIGDPSGKSQERNLLSTQTICSETSRACASRCAGSSTSIPRPNAAKLVNNFDWIGPFSYLGFLRDVGKNFPVNVMLAKDSVKGRLEQRCGLSYTEFSYMLLQAFDFVYLYDKYNCELQVGGSDQWGNITAGIDLGRRMRGVQLYGLTSPLLTKSDGTKMGKTETGTVWLSPKRTSPYQFYQYWIRTEDADVGKVLADDDDASARRNRIARRVARSRRRQARQPDAAWPKS